MPVYEAGTGLTLHDKGDWLVDSLIEVIKKEGHNQQSLVCGAERCMNALWL